MIESKGFSSEKLGTEGVAVSGIFEVSMEFAGVYRERDSNPEFWAEPLNAVSNASFLIAAAFAFYFATRRNALNPTSLALIVMAGVIGCGSFIFHTVPNRLTMWLDIIPIALFQVCFLWLAMNKMLRFNGGVSAAVVIGVVGTSFALRPIHDVLNGSLFYMPTLFAILVLGTKWADRTQTEPYLLISAAGCFALAVAARTVDWMVPWQTGSHFVWHLLNGIVIYLTLRALVIFVASEKRDIGSAVSN